MKITISTRKLASLTDENFHTEARLLISKRLKNKEFVDAYKSVMTLQEYPKYFGEVFGIRNSIDKDLKEYLFENCINAQEVWNKL